MDACVIELPRGTRPLFEGGIGACSRFIDGQTAPEMTRLVLVVSAAPPDVGPDASVCLPCASFAD